MDLLGGHERGWVSAENSNGWQIFLTEIVAKAALPDVLSRGEMRKVRAADRPERRYHA
jgi:hypothetical protein